MDLPSTPTFLFTDIAGSTRLWEKDPGAMAVAVADHDGLLHSAVEQNGGMVFKGLGDGICAVFGSAADGLAAACDGQLGLQAHEWGAAGPLRVRMALHSGPAQTRGGDFFGTTVNRVARLLVTAHAGQVVMTEATAELVEEGLPTDTGLSDLGMHRLKDLSRPERVFQLNHLDLPGEFPTLRSLDAHLGNLPYRLTEFIGRDEEIAAVQDLVTGHRLVTLSGPGGIGKTSLALRAAAEIIDEFADGVWLVKLAALTDDVQIPGAIAGLFGIEAAPAQDPTNLLVRELAGKKTLLILDNCEHLVDGVAKLTDTLLRSTREMRVLATSREPLRIDGETLYRLPSLDLPDEDAPPDEAGEAAAVALFLDRAQLVRPGFVLNGDGPAVVDICRRLDGIPLAIELAAARMSTLTIPQLAERLDDRFRVLTRGSRAALPRQQTLQAAVDWSHDLLTEPDQVLLRRLGVFGGTFTAAAAEHVCGFEPLEPFEVGDRLDRLVETSLVAPPEPDSGRYRTLETIRAYARLKLDTARETETTMQRLADYLLGAGPPTHDGIPQSDVAEWVQWRADEIDNFRSALQWARSTGEGTVCGELAVELANYLTFAGLARESEICFESALDLLGDEPAPLRLRLLSLLAGSVAESNNPTRARALIDAVRRDAEELADEATAAVALLRDAQLTYSEGNLELALTRNSEAADRLQAAADPRFESTVAIGIEILGHLGRYDEAETLIDRLDSDWVWAGKGYANHRANAFRGSVANVRGDYAKAIGLFQSCIESARPFGQYEIGGMMLQLALAEFGSRNYPAAHHLFQEAESLLSELFGGSGGSFWLAVLALIELHHQGPRAAVSLLRDALDIAASPSEIPGREPVLVAVSEAAEMGGQPDEAAILLAAGQAARELVVGLVPSHPIRECRKRVEEQLHRTLSAGELEALFDEGKSLSYDEAAQRAHDLLDKLTAEV